MTYNANLDRFRPIAVSPRGVDASAANRNHELDRSVDDEISFVAHVRFEQNNHRTIYRTTLMGATSHLAPPADATGHGYCRWKSVIAFVHFHNPRTQRSLIQRPRFAVVPVHIDTFRAPTVVEMTA